MACTECGSKKFYGHQQCRMTVTVDEDGNWLDGAKVYDAEEPYGPFECTECGKEFDPLPVVPPE